MWAPTGHFKPFALSEYLTLQRNRDDRRMLLETTDVAPPNAEGDRADDVALAASGDRRAFERLYRVHVNHVYSICVRMTGDRVRAEELTQDVFIRVWEKLPLFRGESAFSTWLHRLAVNVVLNERKVMGRERSRTAATDDEDGDESGARGVN